MEYKILVFKVYKFNYIKLQFLIVYKYNEVTLTNFTFDVQNISQLNITTCYVEALD